MYPIVRKEKLADNIILMDIKAPRVAKESAWSVYHRKDR